MRSHIAAILVSSSLMLSVGCDGGFDEATGVYSGNGITATFPAGWGDGFNAPNMVVSRADPDSETIMMLTVQTVPAEFTIERYEEESSRQLRSQGVVQFDSGVIEADGVEGGWRVADQVLQGESFRSISYHFMHGGKMYLLVGLTEKSEFGEWETRFDEVAKSIDFSDP